MSLPTPFWQPASEAAARQPKEAQVLDVTGEPILLPFDLRRSFGRWLAGAVAGRALPPTFALKRYELAQSFRRQVGPGVPAPLSALQFDIARGGGDGQEAAARAAESECLLLAAELVGAFPEAHKGFHTLVVSHAAFSAGKIIPPTHSPSPPPLPPATFFLSWHGDAPQ